MCRPGERRGSYFRGECLWVPAFAGTTVDLFLQESAVHQTSHVQFHDFAPPAGDFRAAVLAGLAQSPKRLPSRFIYDERGSRLFEAILEQPEYYIPRAEIVLLQRHAAELAARAGPRAYVVDYGSGS